MPRISARPPSFLTAQEFVRVLAVCEELLRFVFVGYLYWVVALVSCVIGVVANVIGMIVVD